VLVNISAVVMVVLVNKYIYNKDNFKYMVTLSSWHLVTTGIASRIMLKMGLYKYKDPDGGFSKVLPVAFGSLGSIVFMNLNLAHNSVGLYQISKLACVPVTLIIERVFYGTRVSAGVLLALLPILGGVGLATVTDVSLNYLGSCFAGAAILCTVMGQIYTNTLQKALRLDSMQMLYHASMPMAVGMFLMAPLFEDVGACYKSVLGLDPENPVSNGCKLRILVSCVCSVAINVTNFFVVGKTSPLTYQVVGHFKTVLLLGLGFWIFNYQVIPKNVLGMAIALCGVIAYTEVKRKQAAVAKSAVIPK
jgi:solute carrier family 35 protein E3